MEGEIKKNWNAPSISMLALQMTLTSGSGTEDQEAGVFAGKGNG
jgi:hypothetical protein